MVDSDFLAGIRDVVPLLPGFVPLGIVTGVAGRNLGMTAGEAIAMSALIFAGLAQLTALELLDQGAPIWVAATSALMLNLRFSMFSASLEPYLRSFARSRKWLAGFVVSTPAYVLSIARFESEGSFDRHDYYFGAAIPMYLTWVGSTATGAIVGARIPPGWQLDFVIPLVFMAMLFKLLDGTAASLAAGSASLVAVAGTGLPFNLGLIVAGVIGMTGGLLADTAGGER